MTQALSVFVAPHVRELPPDLWLNYVANFLRAWFTHERQRVQDGSSLIDLLIKRDGLTLADIDNFIKETDHV